MLQEEVLALLIGRQLLRILDLEDEVNSLRFQVNQVNEPHEPPDEPVAPDNVAPTVTINEGTHYQDEFTLDPKVLGRKLFPSNSLYE